jgi:hypothetical protein
MAVVVLVVVAGDRLQEVAGCAAGTPCCRRPRSAAFDQRYGFAALRDGPLHLYLPLATVADAFGDEGGS